VLRLLADKSCPLLLSFYESNQEERYHKAIFSEFCHFKSFSHYMYYFSLSMSLRSKLEVLLHVMLGLLFLKRNNISHLDIKPDNIMIAKGMRCKISDFGEAYHPTLTDYRITGTSRSI